MVKGLISTHSGTSSRRRRKSLWISSRSADDPAPMSAAQRKDAMRPKDLASSRHDPLKSGRSGIWFARISNRDTTPVSDQIIQVHVQGARNGA